MKTVRDIQYAVTSEDLIEIEEIIESYKEENYTTDVEFSTHYIPSRGEYAIQIHQIHTGLLVGYIGAAYTCTDETSR